MTAHDRYPAPVRFDSNLWRQAEGRLSDAVPSPRCRWRGAARRAWGSGRCVLAVASLLMLAGCASAPPRDLTQARVFPQERTRAGVVDVQVIRDGTRIRIANSSPRSFAPGSVLWLNQRFSRGLDGWAPGEQLTLDLREFRDEFGESFRAGGFFASQRPDTIVLAEVQTPAAAGGDEFIGLVVVRGEAD